MILTLIFVLLIVLPLLIVSVVYLVKLCIYLIRKRKSKKIISESKEHYEKFETELSKIKKPTLKGDMAEYQRDKLLNKYCLSQIELANKYGIHCERNYYVYEVYWDSEETYIKSQLEEANIKKPEFYNPYDSCNDSMVFSAVSSFIGTIGAVVTGMIAIVTNSSHYCNVTRNEVTAEVTTLQTNQQVILKQKELGKEDWAKAAVEHNNNVKTFYIKIENEQTGLNNPVISWFHCPVYSTVSLNEINSFYVKI